jgi:hypothetical protein
VYELGNHFTVARGFVFYTKHNKHEEVLSYSLIPNSFKLRSRVRGAAQSAKTVEKPAFLHPWHVKLSQAEKNFVLVPGRGAATTRTPTRRT